MAAARASKADSTKQPAPPDRRAVFGCILAIALATFLGPARAADNAAAARQTSAHTVAVVNGQPISRAVFDELAKAHTGIPNPYDEPSVQDELERKKALHSLDRNKVLEDLVVMEVLAQKARESGMHLQPDVMAEAEIQYKTLLGQRLVRDIISQITVTPDEIAARYASQKPEQQYRVGHILTGSEAAAKAAIADIERGAAFEKVAQKRSVDVHTKKTGDLGWMMLNQMTEPFAAAVGRLNAGEITRRPVETPDGWHVIRLHGMRDLKKPPPEAMQSVLRMELLREKVQARVRQLAQEAKIEVMPSH